MNMKSPFEGLSPQEIPSGILITGSSPDVYLEASRPDITDFTEKRETLPELYLKQRSSLPNVIITQPLASRFSLPKNDFTQSPTKNKSSQGEKSHKKDRTQNFQNDDQASLVDVLVEEKRFYQTSALQYQRTIEELQQELMQKNTILRHLQSEAIKMRVLEDEKVRLEKRLIEEQKENQLFKDAITRLKMDSQKMESSVKQNSKNDEQIRLEIFSEIQVLRRQLAEARKRETALEENIITHESNIKSMSIDRLATPNLEKLRKDLENREAQIIQLQQHVTKYEAENIKQETVRNELNHKIRSLENSIKVLESQLVSSEEFFHRRASDTLLSKALSAEAEALKRAVAANQLLSSKQMQKMGAILGAKDQEIAKLREILRSEQVKYQQICLNGAEGSRLLVQEIEDFKSALFKKELTVQNLQESLINKQKSIGETEVQKTKLESRVRYLESEHRIERDTLFNKIKDIEAVSLDLKSKLKYAESLVSNKLIDVSDGKLEARITELTEALDMLRAQNFSMRKEYDERVFQLENIRNEQETKLGQFAQALEQKEGEKAYLETQNKTLYATYIEAKKEMVDLTSLQEENSLLKLKLTSREEDLFRVKTDLQKHAGKVDLDSRRVEQSTKAKFDNQPRDLLNTISSLRKENHSLKELLEDAREKAQEHSAASQELEELQGKIFYFQERTERFLKSGRPSRKHFNASKQSQVMVNEAVQQLKQKMRVLKKENEQLKVQMGSKQSPLDSNDLIPEVSEENSKETQKASREQLTQIQKIVAEFQKQKEQEKQKMNTRVNQLKERMLEIKKNKFVEHNQKIALLIQEVNRLTELCEQYENRIREYQGQFLKLRHKQRFAAEEMTENKEKMEIEYQQQIADNNEDIKMVADRASYIKTKNEELEQRVDHLLAINVELKTQLQKQAELIKVFEGGDLYRYQIQLLEEKVDTLQRQLEAVFQENNQLKQQAVFHQQEIPMDEVSRFHLHQLTTQLEASKQALLEAQRKNTSIEQNYRSKDQHSSSLEARILDLQQILQTHKTQNQKLSVEHQRVLKQTHSNDHQEQTTNRMSQMQREIYRLQESNRRLSQGPGTRVPSEGLLDAYQKLLNEIDKMLQRVDLVKTYCSDLVELISQNEESQFVVEIKNNIRRMVDFLKDIDGIKFSIGAIRRQQERHGLKGEATIFDM